MGSIRIGVLALQGAFAEHLAMLRRLDRELTTSDEASGVDGQGHGPSRGLEALEVRLLEHLASTDALIIPGGESTTIGKLMVEYGLLEPIRERIAQGMPVFGTCAGAIVLAQDIGGLDQPIIGAMGLSISRNAFGRQLQSFEVDLAVPALGERPVRGVFIRAPAIRCVGPEVEILARLSDRTIVAARQRHLLATVFHPELTEDTRFHRYFLEMVGE